MCPGWCGCTWKYFSGKGYFSPGTYLASQLFLALGCCASSTGLRSWGMEQACQIPDGTSKLSEGSYCQELYYYSSCEALRWSTGAEHTALWMSFQKASNCPNCQESSRNRNYVDSILFQRLFVSENPSLCLHSPWYKRHNCQVFRQLSGKKYLSFPERKDWALRAL